MRILGRGLSLPLESVFRVVLVGLLMLPIFDAHFSHALFLSDDLIHFAIPGLEFLSAPVVLFITGWSVVVFGAFAVSGQWLRVSILGLGISSLSFCLGSTENRFAFVYYVPLAMIAYGLQKLTRSNRRLTILFVGAVYLTAAMQKLIVFPTMIDFLPALVEQTFVRGFTESHSELSNFLAHFFAWTVIPVELSMGFFFLFDRTRRYAFLLACTFHSMIGVINHGDARLWSVGTCVLTMHALVAVSCVRSNSESYLRVRDVVHLPHGVAVFGFWLMAVTGYIFYREPGFVRQLAETVSLLLPLIALTGWCYFGTFPRAAFTLTGPDGEPPRAAVIAFAAVMLVWALAPFAMGRTNDHIGFAMYSGGSHKTPFHCFQIKGPRATRCPQAVRRVPILTRRRIASDAVEYCSRQISSLEKFRAWSRARCPEVFIDEATYDVDPDSMRIVFQ